MQREVLTVSTKRKTGTSMRHVVDHVKLEALIAGKRVRWSKLAFKLLWAQGTCNQFCSSLTDKCHKVHSPKGRSTDYTVYKDY
ncbi:hypothetical protein VNO80_20639 [Phaseolus coccineus]|uniref:Uncharacterized protein n=1 Tax=Phaseolus coccineus TaxID=3886 RepID=A0AAN9M1Q9_PHACN